MDEHVRYAPELESPTAGPVEAAQRIWAEWPDTDLQRDIRAGRWAILVFCLLALGAAWVDDRPFVLAFGTIALSLSVLTASLIVKGGGR